MAGKEVRIDDIVLPDFHCLDVLPPDEGISLLDGDDLTGKLSWDGALLLAYYLARHPHMVKGLKVVELGSGMGLAGTVCLNRKPKQLVLTDGNLETLEGLKHNLRRNVAAELPSSCSVRQMRWVHEADIASVKELVGGYADCVIASDVLYSPDSVYPFFDTANQILSSHAAGGSEDQQQAQQQQDYTPTIVLSHFPRSFLQKELDNRIVECAEKYDLILKEIELSQVFRGGEEDQRLLRSMDSEGGRLILLQRNPNQPRGSAL